MKSPYAYNPPGRIRNFKCIRDATLWAGFLGVGQSIIWIGLTITGILSYNCLISVDKTMSYGSLLKTIFLDLYFKGNCNPPTYQNYNTTIIQSVPTVLDPEQILIWDCVYLAIAVCWLLVSILLITHIKENASKTCTNVIYSWVFFTLSICAMDVALGVIFAIDYGNFSDEAYNYNINSANAGPIEPLAAQLLAGMVTSISMMIISFKGFILWIINAGLMVYLLILAIFVARDNDGNDTLFIPRKESDDILATRPPINAYEEQKSISTAVVYSNEAFIPDNNSTPGVIELNQESIARAARMSTDASLQDHRFRNFDAFQQYPPPKHQNNNNNNNNYHTNSLYSNNNIRAVSGREEVIPTNVATSPYPVPDYSPPMSRANNQGQNVLLRNQRYQ